MTPEERAKHIVFTANAMVVEQAEAYIAESIRQAILEEREACAKVAESNEFHCWDCGGGESVAKAIRERK